MDISTCARRRAATNVLELVTHLHVSLAHEPHGTWSKGVVNGREQEDTLCVKNALIGTSAHTCGCATVTPNIAVVQARLALSANQGLARTKCVTSKVKRFAWWISYGTAQ